MQSKALEMSIVTARVLEGGLFLLKPMATGVEIWRRADVVEWRCL